MIFVIVIITHESRWRHVSTVRVSEHPSKRPPHAPRRGFEATAPPGGAATRQIAPPTRAPAGRGSTDARHSRRARARGDHGHRAATVTPQLKRLMLTEMEDQPRAARSAEDEARVLCL
jgi:hypothetical protein